MQPIEGYFFISFLFIYLFIYLFLGGEQNKTLVTAENFRHSNPYIILHVLNHIFQLSLTNIPFLDVGLLSTLKRLYHTYN